MSNEVRAEIGNVYYLLCRRSVYSIALRRPHLKRKHSVFSNTNDIPNWLFRVIFYLQTFIRQRKWENNVFSLCLGKYLYS